MNLLIESCKKNAIWGMEVFLNVLSHVPEDKMHWTPSPTAKSAFRIAAHTAVTNGHFARLIRDQRLPVGEEIPVMVEKMKAEEDSLESLAEIEALLRKNTDEILLALDTLTPEAVALVLDSSLGWSVPMTILMNLPGTHTAMHASQLDYLQTCWDDQVIH